MHNPFRYFNSSPEVIRFAVMLYVRYPLSLRQVEDLLFERGIEICYETVRYWWNRFGPLFAAEIRARRVHHGSYSNWRWHLDEVFVRFCQVTQLSTTMSGYETGTQLSWISFSTRHHLACRVALSSIHTCAHSLETSWKRSPKLEHVRNTNGSLREEMLSSCPLTAIG